MLKMLNMPLHMLLVMLACWINRQKLAVIEHPKEETRVLRELHHKRRLRFTDDQRRRLGVKARRSGGSCLARLTATSRRTRLGRGQDAASAARAT